MSDRLAIVCAKIFSELGFARGADSRYLALIDEA